MAYAQPPQYPSQPTPQPGPRRRPMTVTIAVWTQFATAIVLIATAIAQFSVQETVKSAVEELVRSDPTLADAGITPEDIAALMGVLFVAVAVVYIIFAVFYIVLGLLNNAGKRPARILSWILSGIALLCCGFGGVIGQLGSGSATYTVNGEEYNEELNRAIENATPGWVTALEWVSLLLFIIGSILVIILLALAPSNEFFRKEEPEQGFYPGQPPYGQPPYGEQPPGPGQPPYPGR